MKIRQEKQEAKEKAAAEKLKSAQERQLAKVCFDYLLFIMSCLVRFVSSSFRA
jgi:hypothetical protein